MTTKKQTDTNPCTCDCHPDINPCGKCLDVHLQNAFHGTGVEPMKQAEMKITIDGSAIEFLLESLYGAHESNAPLAKVIRKSLAQAKADGAREELEALVNKPGATHDDVYYAAVERLAQLNEYKQQ